MAEWDTDLELDVLADGTVDFTGFYGEYEVTIGGDTFLFDLTKEISDYALIVGPPSADFDLDGDVDGRDFLTWQRGFSSTSPAFADGDANYDGVVNESDLAVWQAGFAGSWQATTATVPEPAASVLLIMGTVLVTRRHAISNRAY
jgi:hypothetical protein